MDERTAYRERLLMRLLRATGASSMGLALAAACGGSETTQIGVSDHTGVRDSGAGGAGAVTAAGGASGATAAGGDNSIFMVGGGGGNGLVLGTGGAPDYTDAGNGTVLVHRCIDGMAALPTDAGADAGADAGFSECRKPAELLDTLDRQFCDRFGEVLVGVRWPPSVEGLQCCYDFIVKPSCFIYIGRAFLVDDGLVKSAMRKGDGWSAGSHPNVEGLDATTRRALAEAWIKDGLFEHASIASFARFAMQLLVVGAPSRLLHETLAAGKDEIRHAELCFALASDYAGEALEPGEFPLEEYVKVDHDLAAIVEETIVEGCIGETLAALQADVQMRRASDPAVVAALESTIEDETRHAELAWRVVAWAIETGGERIRDAARKAFEGFRPPDRPYVDLTGVDGKSFEAHGRLTAEDARAAALEALERVVRPCAAALLGRDVFLRKRTEEEAPACT